MLICVNYFNCLSDALANRLLKIGRHQGLSEYNGTYVTVLDVVFEKSILSDYA